MKITPTVLGWVMVAVGLATIGFTVNLTYEFFTAKAEFPQVFKPAVVQQPVPVAKSATPNSNPQETAQAQIQQSVRQALSSLLPPDSITKLMNIIAWSVFATILIFAGGKVASIGIQLMSVKS